MSHTEDASLVSVPSLGPSAPTSAPNPNPDNQDVPEGPAVPDPPTTSTLPNPSPNPSTSFAPQGNAPEWANLLQMMINSQNQFQTQLQAQLQAQQTQLHELVTNSPRNSWLTARFQNLIKFSDLTKFSRKSREVKAFVKTIETRIANAQDALDDDFQMVSYFVSWLGPRVPEKWYFGIRESQPHLLNNNYDAFVKEFVGHFGDPDTVETAQ